MLALIALLWCVYLADCVTRQRPGAWTLRARLLRGMSGIAGPDFALWGERFAFAWTPLLPWLPAFTFTGVDLRVAATRRRLEAISRDTRPLRIAAGVLFVWVMGVLPLLVLTGWFVPVLLPWLIVGSTAWIITLVRFFAAHRRVHGRGPTPDLWLALTLSPLSLMRAPTAVAYDAARASHPVAAAAVLCGDAEFLRIARLWYFDNAAIRPGIEEAARARGLAGRLLTGPAAWEPGVTQFCPRCHGTYTDRAAGCTECPEVPLQPLAAQG